MRQELVKRKKRAGILFILVLFTFLFLLSIGKRGFIQQFRVRLQRRQLKKEIVALKEEKKRLEKEKEKLNDPETIEKIAREEYGMARKNEKVYRVIPKEKK